MTERISLYVGPRGKLCGAGSAPISPRDLPVLQDGATVRPPSFGVNWIIKV